MKREDHYRHFAQRAKERYNLEVDESLWVTINETVEKQKKGSTLVCHRRDGELWHIIKNKIIPMSMFIIFDKGMSVTCLPSTKPLRRQLSYVQNKAKRGKPVPLRVILDDDDMFFRHCFLSMMDYYGHQLTRDEWDNWNTKIKNNDILFIQNEPKGIKSGRIIDNSRSLVVAYKNGKTIDVRPPSKYWQDRIHQIVSKRKANANDLLAQRIRDHKIVF